MKIESFLGNNQKESLDQLKKEISKEIYRYCLLANIDPETFDYKKFLLEHKNNLNSITIKYYPDLVSYCDKLSLVENKIEELDAN